MHHRRCYATASRPGSSLLRSCYQRLALPLPACKWAATTALSCSCVPLSRAPSPLLSRRIAPRQQPAPSLLSLAGVTAASLQTGCNHSPELQLLLLSHAPSPLCCCSAPLLQPAPWLLSAAGVTAASLQIGCNHNSELQLFARPSDRSIVTATLQHHTLAAACSVAAISGWRYRCQPANGLQC